MVLRGFIGLLTTSILVSLKQILNKCSLNEQVNLFLQGHRMNYWLGQYPSIMFSETADGNKYLRQTRFCDQ